MGDSIGGVMESANIGAQPLMTRAQRGRAGGAQSRPVRRRRAQRGVAAVEFALVLPLLLLLLFGIVEMGFLLYDKSVITSASRAAARQAVAFGEDATGVPVYLTASSVQGIATGGLSTLLVNFGSGSPSVTITNSTSGVVTGSTQACSSGASLTVAVSYPFTGFGFGASAAINPLSTVANALTLSSSTTMSCE